MKKLIKSLLTLVFIVTPVIAAPFNLSLTPDIALKDRSERINGLVLGVWSENPQSGFALGIINGSKGNSEGISWAFLMNYTDDYTGGHLGLLNYANGYFRGAQIGAANYAEKLSGLQLGYINYARTIDNGIQIGLINIVPETQTWLRELPHYVAPIFPFFNWRFE